MPKKLRSLFIFGITFTILSAAAAWQASTPKTLEVLPALSKPMQYWKGNLHTHSLWSDGDDFPEMIGDWYKTHGYHFLALSDHNVLSEGDKWLTLTPAREKALEKYRQRFGNAWVEQRQGDDKKIQVRLKPLREFRSLLEGPAQFLFIPAEEITHKFAKKPVHINGINLRDAIVPIDGNSVRETIQTNLRVLAEQKKKTGWKMLGFLNHPNFGWGVNAEDFLVEELRYFEVYNGHPGVKNPGDDIHASTEKMWDIANAIRLTKLKMPLLYGLATDDAHGYHAFGIGKVNPGRGWIMVQAPYLSAEAMVKAMEQGDFYFSTGVTLRGVPRVKNELTISIQGEKGIIYKTEFIATFKNAPLDSKPRLDEKGKPLDVTREYSPEIGKVVLESKALESKYQFNGNELYVRARITSTKLHPNPFQKGDVEMGWTQPVLGE